MTINLPGLLPTQPKPRWTVPVPVLILGATILFVLYGGATFWLAPRYVWAWWANRVFVATGTLGLCLFVLALVTDFIRSQGDIAPRMRWLLVYNLLWLAGALLSSPFVIGYHLHQGRPALDMFEHCAWFGLAFLVVTGPLNLFASLDLEDRKRPLASCALSTALAAGLWFGGHTLQQSQALSAGAAVVLATAGCILGHWIIAPGITLLGLLSLLALVSFLAVSCALVAQATLVQALTLLTTVNLLMLLIPFLGGHVKEIADDNPLLAEGSQP